MATSQRLPWQDTFLSDLTTRDNREKAFDDIISAYLTLAERLYVAEQASSAAAATSSAAAISDGLSPVNDELSRLRADLATAQQQQAALTAQVKTLEALKPQLATITQRLEAAEKKRMLLERRCKDLADEAGTKDRLHQNALDEMLAQEMELNMVLQREQALKKDNQMLVDRWMALKGKEAEAMNEMNSAVDLKK